ncbi:MAG TPA: glycine/sarcosine/betaine reductase selenoprotein B family protein [Pyrinomonadaceae bacterium]|nr:glycine/sarcosine/betaine reductase selenoprotein B family protein [Pyrinomonadaceae bacterium]
MTDVIEQMEQWRRHYDAWSRERPAAGTKDDLDDSYPFVRNRNAPFTPARRALPMLNLALISSAGGYLDGTEPFDTQSPGGDLNFREIPTEIEAEDLRFAARGYDPAAVHEDINAEVPLERLFEFESNGIIGQLNEVFWSFCGFIPDAATFAERTLARLVERLQRYEVQAALLIPASRLCHQSVSLAARAIEQTGISTMTLAVQKDVIENVRPPRAALYEGELGKVAGKPNWPEHQRRILDEALRLIEPIDQPEIRRLVVQLETEVETSRGER